MYTKVYLPGMPSLRRGGHQVSVPGESPALEVRVKHEAIRVVSLSKVSQGTLYEDKDSEDPFEDVEDIFDTELPTFQSLRSIISDIVAL